MFGDNTQIADELMTALYADRQDLYHNDVFRTVIFAGLAFLLLWVFIRNRFSTTWLLAGISLLIVTDLLQIDNRYLNAESFMDESSYSLPFQASEADQQILQDKDPYYRVFNLTTTPFEDAMTSYFHKSVGGYHAAKLQLYADLIERQISHNNLNVLNMLNTKYVIVPGNDGRPVAQRNPDALGNAWFVKHILWAKDADAEMKALDHLNTKDTVVIDQRYKEMIKGSPSFDTTATISLIANNLNEISYSSIAGAQQFAVFSEVYYGQGWNVFIDNERAPYYRVNYALRGMMVPAGKHTITFRFEPSSYYTGIKLAISGYIVMLLLLTGGLVLNMRMNKMNGEKPKRV
jgi:hypothetical protein